MNTFRGKSVLVVGATGVLGGAIARLLAAEGAVVTLAGRNAGQLQAAAATMSGSVGVVADIRDAAAGATLVAAASQHGGGRLDGVVLASGVVAFGELGVADQATMEDVFLTNVLGPLWVIQAALPQLLLSQGIVCALTGVVAERPQPGMAAYSASKAALSSALKALGGEHRRSGVSFVDARPPHTETGLASRAIDGVAPRFPQGLDPQAVAQRIVTAMANREAEVPASAFV
jgi:NADP-dependent 3-hydroxy acid dehydrogenase YdfG